MDARHALLSVKDIYAFDQTERLLVRAVRENVEHHAAHCAFYERYLEQEGFSASGIHSADDLWRIPTLHASFFKRNAVLSVDPQDVAIRATSSGTQGQKTQAFFDADTLALGTRMAINTFRYHGLTSIVPVHYIMLGYEPSEGSEAGAVKTAMGVTRLAPALSRTFLLRNTGDGHQLDRFGFIRALERASRMGVPVRFVGFPAYMALVVRVLREQGMSFRLNRRSLVLLGGGWKKHADIEVGKAELYASVRETLGVPEGNCRDFYSAVEHAGPYAECVHHRMHQTAFSRVIIRDVRTLEPLPLDKPGFLSFVSPLVLSAPMTSVTMGDLAVMRDGRACGCGATSPFFEVIGRAGVSAPRSCAIAASELERGART